jgi:hypothetical protein
MCNVGIFSRGKGSFLFNDAGESSCALLLLLLLRRRRRQQIGRICPLGSSSTVVYKKKVANE